ncbi:glutathione S-transferase [Cristinia sonorae]|uniref:glutathione transferase n=1 Tax=Cristinia sonorae TaxID=1940300 RepID=A0A8K0XN89_9AGAR|nr:glutathione S-transferase [Cristinia sonorae]
MVLKLYGHTHSTCTARVAAVLTEYKVPFELVIVDLFKGEHKSPEYLAFQPFGQLPYINDDGLIIYESRAISRYIAAKYRSNVSSAWLPLPEDIAKTAKFEQAVNTEAFKFDAFASTAAFELFWKPGGPDAEYAKKLLENLNASLDAYEVILSKQKYLAGDELTLADIFHLPYANLLHNAKHINLEDEKRPNVARWWKELSTLPSWLAVKDGVKSPA